MTIQEKLTKHYSQKSKHSNYQILPRRLEPILGKNHIEVRTRYERERLDYILSNIDITGKSVLDIGGNTGFFSFELLDAGAKSAHLYEGNREHCEFVRLATEAVGLNSLTVTNGYYQFEETTYDSYDVALLLNVLHHIGDDYGNRALSMDEAKKKMTEQLNNMRFVAEILVFQLGFNWHGDPKSGLFGNGTKQEMIEFIKTSSADYWDIKAIGIAEKNESKVVYYDLNDKNIERDDTLGEFLNRPLFILERRQSHD